MKLLNRTICSLLLALGFSSASGAGAASSDLLNSKPTEVGSFKSIRQMLSFGRSGHNVEVLADGRVLVAGGAWGDLGGENSSEILSIDDQRVRFGGLKMSSLRSAATLARLRDGRLLLMGGATDFEMAISTTDLFDPATNSFSPGPNLVTERSGHASVALADGRVFVFGGTDGDQVYDSIEIFEPSRGTFSLADAKMHKPRSNLSAILVNSSTIALIGGETNQTDSEVEGAAPFLASIELFDISTLQSTLLPTRMASPRVYHTAARLDDNRILIAGGLSDYVRASDSVEILNIADRSIVHVGSTLRARSMHTLTFLRDGSFLIAGGVENGLPLADSEHCRFIAREDINCISGAKMQRPRWGHTATPLPNGRILFVGGLTNVPETPGKSAGPVRGLELYLP